MKTLKETLKEFDDLPIAKSISAYLTDVEYKMVKSFISQSIKTTLESVVMEKYAGKYFDTNDEGFYLDGWMDCREKLLKNIENYLKN